MGRRATHGSLQDPQGGGTAGEGQLRSQNPSLTGTVHSGSLHLPDHTVELKLHGVALAARPQGAVQRGLQGHGLET